MRILETLRRRLGGEESGFTLVEVLVVTIIIGILAAIALAALIGERGKAQDANARSDLGILAAQMETCYVETGDFTECDTQLDLGNIGIQLDDSVRDGGNTTCAHPGYAGAPSPGSVGVRASNDDCYVIAATSEAADGGANHVFISIRASNGDRSRTCGPTAGPDIRGHGTCRSDGTW